MGISGRSCVETLEYLLFKGLVPYAVLVRGEQRCVFGREGASERGRERERDAGADTVTDRELQSTSPHYLF